MNTNEMAAAAADEASDRLALDHESNMVAQGGRYTPYLEDGQELMASCKLLSLTLLSGTRYRIALKLGTLQRPEWIVTGVLDAEHNLFQPEGDLAPAYDRMSEIEDPMVLPADQRPGWFTAHLVETWVRRFFETGALAETAVWGQ